ncbi:hypothetical protein BGP77_12615, partial [Saccharospirillum sp. MSK14-1]|uniref:glycosyltransferase family 4 protein n=1 Tax=Saccharospirillum sp. MSK14-1 TaxID=1897632 RepID=UPI000D42A4DA
WYSIEYQIIDCKGSFNFRFLFRLIRLIRKERISHIQAHLLGSNVYASLAGLVSGVPVTCTFHGHVDISNTERFKKLKFYFIGKASEHIVAVTEELSFKIRHENSILKGKEVSVIPNGIDTSDLKKIQIRKLPNGQDETIIFGCLGNIREAKNYFLAVDFIKALTDNNVNAKLIIAGDDTKLLAKILKSYINTAGMNSNIDFPGFIHNIKMFFEEIDIFLMTSSSEGHPLSITQAMSSGKPILTTPSGVEKILSGLKSAFISQDHDPEFLMQKFITLRDLPPEMLCHVLDVTRHVVNKKYSLESMTSAYIIGYREK